jgi:hypothetical protein
MGSGHTNEIYYVLEDHRGVTWFTTGAGPARRVNGSIEKLDPYARSPHGPTYRIYEVRKGTCGSTSALDFSGLPRPAWSPW